MVVLVLAAHLSARELGVLSVPLFLSTVLIALNDLGFGQALIFQRDRLKEAAETASFVSLVIGVVMAFVLLLEAPAIAAFFRVPEATPLIRVYSAMVALDGYVTVPLMRLNRELAFRQRFMLETLPQVVGALLTIVLTLRGVGVWSLALGDGTRFLITSALVLVLSTVRVRPRWHSGVARQMWRFARGSMVASGLDIVLLNIDYALVARLLGPVALGYYSLAFRIAIVPFFTVTMVVIGTAWPAFARLTHDRERLRAAFRISVRVGMAAVFLIAGGIIIAAPWVQILGARWATVVSTTRLLAIFVVLRSGAYFVEAFFQSTGRPGANAILRAIWAVLLAGVIVAVSGAGVEAVAVGQVSVALILLILHLAAAGRMREIEIGRFFADLVRPAIAVSLACVAVLSAQTLTGWVADHASWPGLVVTGGSYVAVCVALLRWLAPSLVADVSQFRARLSKSRPMASPVDGLSNIVDGSS